MNQNIQPITQDLVREMRGQGLYDYADKLLETHLASIKKIKIDEKNNIRKKDRLIKLHYKVCSALSCHNQVVLGKTLCQKHIVGKAISRNRNTEVKND